MNVTIMPSYGTCESCNEDCTPTVRIKIGSLVSPTHDIEICRDCASELGVLIQGQF